MRAFYETFDFESMLRDSPAAIQEFLSGEIEFIKNRIRSNSEVLEVGCGYGRVLEVLSRKANRVFGIDFSNRMIELSKVNLSRRHNVAAQLMDADKMAFENNSMDYVLCMDNGFGNMPHIESDVLKEMYRVCKKGGEIVVSVFSENAKEAQMENYERVGLKNIKDNGQAIETQEGLYSRRFSRSDLNELFKRVGLKCRIIKISRVNYIAYATKS